MSSATPVGWAHVELGEVAEFRNGINYNKSNFGTGIPVISVKDFWERSFPQYDSLEEINPDGVARPEHALRNGDILFVRSNGNRELIGRSLFIRNLPDRPVTHSAFTIRVRFTSRLVDPRFFAYLFRSPIIRQVLSAQGNGANISNLNQDILARLKVALPPMKAQQSIAAILSAYDDLIENNTRRIAILEDMARRIYEEWFVRFRFPGHEGVGMVDSELGLVPATWRVLPMSAVAEVIDCLHSKKPAEQEDGAGLMLQLFNVADNGILDLTKRFRVSAEDYAMWTSRMEAKEGDCVITNVGRVGAVAQIPQGVKAALGRNMTGVRAKQGAMGPTYLLRYLLSSHMESEIVKKKDPGTIMDSLNVKGIVRLSVPIADVNTMQAFERVAAPMRRQVEVLVLKNANLRATRDLLLPRLISGDLDVSAMSEPEALAA